MTQNLFFLLLLLLPVPVTSLMAPSLKELFPVPRIYTVHAVARVPSVSAIDSA
ncbi:hypothetical protein ASPWEDRAFT_35293 [Aspergillus wentii DTO 134E9]|uniref:Uncharacterized protein n=1 Tax=Aspergillus wentii DTO 134E9 TaxID=1073089 RepID=A0A1L9S3G7_ASPWE|nr:uncharacterized protein ASPWEDRAFT_35293 [Aspergillus wentii DTO 134E9]OJJ41690.1 hypothetical protein ASPWEDRAFT_35293 [Aspergillus wentii DTO 134E9]